MISEASFIGRPGPAQANFQYFPRLQISEILKCLSELGLSITKEELARPEENKDSIRKLLEYLAEICTGVSREELSQPAFSGLNTINYPELHEESIPLLNSLRSIMKMMEICEIRDFSIHDIIAPTASRLQRQLSGIMNFAKFREERLLLLSDLSTTRGGLLETLGQHQEKNESLNNRLTLLRSQTAEEAELIEQLEAETSALQESIHEARRAIEFYDGQIHTNTESFETLSQRIGEASQQLESLQTSRQRLQQQVVTSPEKFRKRIIEVGQALQHEQKDGKLAEKKVRELSAWLLNVEEAQSEVSGALEGIQEVRSEVERQKAIIAELDAQKQGLHGMGTTLNELQQAVSQQARQAIRAEEKLNGLRKQASNRAELSQKSLESAHAQLIEAEAFRLQVHGRSERAEAEVRRMEAELAADAERQRAETMEIQDAYKCLEGKVLRHLQGLQRVMETTSAENVSPNLM